MINVSPTYETTMSGVIRPKCDPHITISGVDSEGNAVNLEWSGKNITSLTYTSSIDPIGRELPFQSLEWTEIYTGTFDENTYPTKYNNLAKYMRVNLTVYQDLIGDVKWFELSDKTWKAQEQKTWNEISRIDAEPEELHITTLFLTGTPTTNGQAVTWKAADIFTLINNEEGILLYRVSVFEERQILLLNPLAGLITNAGGTLANSTYIGQALTQTVSNIDSQSNDGWLPKPILFTGKYVDNILNYAAAINYYFVFGGENGSAKVKGYFEGRNPYNETQKSIPLSLQYSYPKITLGTKVTSYTYKEYSYRRDGSSKYEVSPISVFEDGEWMSYWKYKEPGELIPSFEHLYDVDGNLITAYDCLTYAWAAGKVPDSDDSKLTVYPLKGSAVENTIGISSGEIGEAFSEDNVCNVFNNTGSGDHFINYPQIKKLPNSRKDFIKKYFSGQSSTIEIDMAGDASIECNDVIIVETNLYKNGQRVNKEAVVVELTLTYNGTLREKLICHEVDLNAFG